MLNPRWHGPIALVMAAAATALIMLRPGCDAGGAAPVAGGWCAGTFCSVFQEACEGARKSMESPPACERVRERWCADASCFRYQIDCSIWRDAQVRDGAAISACQLTPWR